MPDQVERRTDPAPGPQPASPLGIASGRDMERQLARQGRRLKALKARVAERDRLSRRLRERVIERGLYATWLESEVRRREEHARTLLDQLDERSIALQRSADELHALRTSRAWRLMSFGLRQVGRARRLGRGVLQAPGRFSRLVRDVRGSHAIAPEFANGHAGFAHPVPGGEAERPEPTPPNGTQAPPRDRNAILHWIPPRLDPYDVWLEQNAPNIIHAFESLGSLKRQPLFSLIVSVEGVEPRLLRETLASLREQVYPHREFILVGGSTWASASLGGSIRFVDDRGDPSGAIREAAELATGEYVIVIRGGDRLAPDALLAFARAIEEAEEPPDLILADEDRVDAEGKRFGPRFRPGWSPELLLSSPEAVGRAWAVRRSAFEAAGGLRPEFGEAWPYDLALRLVETTDRIALIPRVLVSVHSNRPSDGTPEPGPVRSLAPAARALAEAIGRRGIDARVVHPDWAARRNMAAFALDFPDRGPRVAILIPTRDRIDLLRRCLDSIRRLTTYRDYEIVIIDNGSEEPESLAFFDRLEHPCKVVRIENEDGRFSYAALHNTAIRALDESAEFVVLLNNDTEVRRPEWLSQLVGYGQVPGVGAVGGRLLYADGRVQHAGMVTDLFDGVPGHVFKGVPWWHADDQGLDRVARNVGAVTAACMLVRRRTFLDLGGFDEQRFAIGYNDVDFCLRLGASGLRRVYAPRAELLHFEGASRGIEDDLGEREAFRRAWAGQPDPHHHPSLVRREDRAGICTRRHGPLEELGDRPLRVLFDLGSLDGDDSSRFVRTLIEAARQRGTILPAVRSRRDGSIAARLREAGIPVEIEPDEPGSTALQRARNLADSLARGDYDLIHAVGLEDFEAPLAAGLAGLPSVWTIREAIDFRDSFGEFDEQSAREVIGAFSEAYRVTFPSWGVRQFTQPLESRWNFEVVREAAGLATDGPDRREVRARLGLDPTCAVIGGVLGPDRESAEVFLKALLGLVRSGRDVIAQVFASDEALRALSRDEAVRSLGGRVRLLPIGEAQQGKLATSDLLVVASHRETDPEIIATGQQYGLPLVVSDVPGVDEYVRPDLSALVFDPDDDRALRQCIERLLDDRELRRDLVASAAVPSSIEEMFARYERLYREAVCVRMTRPSGALAIQGERD